MDQHDNSESVAMGSAHENDTEHASSENLNEETYCTDQLNVSGNSCDCAGYFEMPECVMDIYLLALDGGDESNAALRQISDVYGPKSDDKEIDSNCNHNVNPEPCPNEGCGCTGSYNGGAGAGTAVCDCDPCSPYESGFKDKKRDAICCCCQGETYQKGLANKKPDCNDEYAPGFLGSPRSCPLQDSCNHRPTQTCFACEDTYQQPLVNKKPECPDKYIPVIPPPEPYCRAGDGFGSYALQRYKSRSPDRSTFYADDSCDCPGRNESCNNNVN